MREREPFTGGLELEREPGAHGWTFRVPAGSPLLEGHFPGDPVLPGVALIALVEELLATGPGARRVLGVRSVRWRLPIRPGMRCAVRLEEADPGRVRFHVDAGRAPACAGTLLVGPAPGGPA